MNNSTKLRCLMAVLIVSLPVALAAQDEPVEDLSAHWDGTWIAEGTLFTIAVTVADGRLKVSQVESLGFVWTNEDGVIDGNTVRVAVDYAGVNGVVQAELVDANTAVAFAASCAPEFMVVCALTKDRQAVFRRVTETSD